MFAEELTKIKESEEKAEALQKDARVSSRQMVEDAAVKAEQIIEDAENRAKDIYDGLLAEGRKTSDAEYDLFLASMEKECQEMAEKAKNNENKAIDLIAERIVRASVNR